MGKSAFRRPPSSGAGYERMGAPDDHRGFFVQRIWRRHAQRMAEAFSRKKRKRGPLWLNTPGRFDPVIQTAQALDLRFQGIAFAKSADAGRQIA